MSIRPFVSVTVVPSILPVLASQYGRAWQGTLDQLFFAFYLFIQGPLTRAIYLQRDCHVRTTVKLLEPQIAAVNGPQLSQRFRRDFVKSQMFDVAVLLLF